VLWFALPLRQRKYATEHQPHGPVG
jgi:hypothetical protein